MNREILFRGKRMDNGEWEEGSLVVKNTGDVQIVILGGWIHVRVDPFTVGQYTGLKDRNGKRIFEGDVLFDPHPSIKKHYTVICEGGTFYRRTSNGHYLSLTVLNSIDFEVIGNIHDNKNLLKNQEVGE